MTARQKRLRRWKRRNINPGHMPKYKSRERRILEILNLV